jgi:aerobic-type carbon monoxide dehydrogenase small subunit (CoxS/CutS family)
MFIEAAFKAQPFTCSVELAAESTLSQVLCAEPSVTVALCSSAFGAHSAARPARWHACTTGVDGIDAIASLGTYAMHDADDLQNLVLEGACKQVKQQLQVVEQVVEHDVTSAGYNARLQMFLAQKQNTCHAHWAT